MPSELRQLALKFQPLRSIDSFFPAGKPEIPLKNPKLRIKRTFDIILAFFLFLGLLSVIIHAVYLYLKVPVIPIQSATVFTKCAQLDGVLNNEKDILRFWSIPYATPPVHTSRLRFDNIAKDLADQLNLPHDGFRWYKPIDVDHDEYCLLSHDQRCHYHRGRWRCKMTRAEAASVCVELDTQGANTARARENCLTLDVSSPKYEGKLLPVVVVMTGFHSLLTPTDPRSPHQPAYIPTDDVVRYHGAVWVTVRYRLGPLGSFYDMGQPNPTENGVDYTNFGLHDQLAALKWVRASIGRFGGDPERVTLLGHGSGATGGLALIGILAQSGRSLFRAAWLASGSVNWYDATDSSGSQGKFKPMQLMEALEPNFVGSATRLKLVKASEVDEKRKRLLTMSETDLMKRIRKFYRQIEWRDAITKWKDKSIGNWFAIDSGFNLTTPNRWSPELIRQVFSSEVESSVKSLVFTSMESEFHELFDTYNISEGLVKDQLDQVSHYYQTDLVKRYMDRELSRLLATADSGQDYDETDILLNALSAARLSCPQAWLIDRWLRELSSGASRSKFYHVVHSRLPDQVVDKVPGPDPTAIKRHPFHGMDMMVLTGNYPNNLGQYRDKLWAMFKEVVINGVMTEQFCEIGTPFQEEKFHLGCRLSDFSSERIGNDDSTAQLCNAIDWNNHFTKVALAE